MKNKIRLDKFYTNENIVDEMMPHVEEWLEVVKKSTTSKLTLVEPSAGSGRWYYKFPNEYNKLAYDIEPEPGFKECKKTDFLKVKGLPYASVMIGNPPFGKHAAMADKFIKKGIDLGAWMIAFVLPLNHASKFDIVYKRQGYTMVFKKYINDITDIELNGVFKIWVRTSTLDKVGVSTSKYHLENNWKLKNTEKIGVNLINENKLVNKKRKDANGEVLIQEGIGLYWKGKCDYYVPMRVYTSTDSEFKLYANWEEVPSSIYFGIRLEDKSLYDKIDVERLYQKKSNNISLSSKQLILKEIQRVKGV